MKRSPIRGGELCMMLRYWILAPESSGILMIWYVPSFTTLLHSLRSQAAMWITLKKRSFFGEWLVAGLWNGLRLCCENSVVQFWFKTVWFLHLDTTYGPPYVPCKLICLCMGSGDYRMVFTGKDNGRANYQDYSIGMQQRMQILIHGVHECAEKCRSSSTSHPHSIIIPWEVHQCRAHEKSIWDISVQVLLSHNCLCKWYESVLLGGKL